MTESISALTATSCAVSLQCNNNGYNAPEILESGRGTINRLTINPRNDLSTLYESYSHLFTQTDHKNHNTRNQEQHIEDNVDRNKSFPVEPSLGEEKPILLTVSLTQCRNAREPEPELKTRHRNQQQESQSAIDGTGTHP